ncbi:UPF0481 protein At3g47200 [Oryza sativa Japonica Group]|uniref:Os08g0355400 protein n=3 Tax=Oryza TaxID=4527 RepID=Q6Z5Z5_ORYSJ|nr:uncharacterized protein LOC4345356 [Oryza sativa Japonica Group]KAF2919332.1 hypothetical protein DAI22_08g127100 [Oryza sativa Japonica Group]BAD03465.1 unknown protein [Oryza sativa Japonica Group]BAT05072.1 Os08g0355400 [Oryza sativa Japonica Group]
MTGGHQEGSSSRTRDVPRGSGGITYFIGRIVVPRQYKPQCVSIGPYHRNMPLRGNVEKKECLNDILRKEAQRRSGDLSSSEIKSEWMNELSRYVDNSPECYYDFNSLNKNEKHMTTEDFLSMLLEDGCYILHKFVVRQDRTAAVGGGGGSGRYREDIDVNVQRDIIYLAENQIPFFILDKINGIIGWSVTGKPLVEVFCSYIEREVLNWYGYAIGQRWNVTPEPIHLLHLLHILLIGCQKPRALTHTHQVATGAAVPTEPHAARSRIEASSANITRQNETAIEMVPVITDASTTQHEQTAAGTRAAHSHGEASSGNHPQQDETAIDVITGASATEHRNEKPPEKKGVRRFLRWRRAKQYEKARVDLTGVDLISIAEGPGGEACGALSILDVKLIGRCGGIRLEFPSLYVDGETWCMLGNLIGLEQSNPDMIPQRVTAYCVLMSQLACTKEDVELLARRRVTDHLMRNDEDCATKFAALCDGVNFNLDDPSRNYLQKECVALDQRYRSRPSQWTAWMLREHCRNPCVAVASVLAIIAIAFGVLQAVYTVLKLVRKVK